MLRSADRRALQGLLSIAIKVNWYVVIPDSKSNPAPAATSGHSTASSTVNCAASVLLIEYSTSSLPDPAGMPRLVNYLMQQPVEVQGFGDAETGLAQAGWVVLKTRYLSHQFF